MTSANFAYWLQGFFEISDTNQLTTNQVDMIKAHLNLVFKHEIDPQLFTDKSKLDKSIYTAIHRGAKDKDQIHPLFRKSEWPTAHFGFSEVQLNC